MPKKPRFVCTPDLLADLLPRLSARVEHYRHAHGWTQEYLSKVSGVGLGTLYGLVQEKHMPRLDVVVKLASVFGVGLDDMVKDEPAAVDPDARPEDHGKGLGGPGKPRKYPKSDE